MTRCLETASRYSVKRLPALMTVLLLTIMLYNTPARAQCGGAAAIGDFRSFRDGGWTQASTWETFDGTTWGPASSTPGGGSTTGQTTVCTPHTVTLPITISTPFSLGGRLHVEAGATVATPINFQANIVFLGTEIINDGTIEAIITFDGSASAATTLTVTDDGTVTAQGVTFSADWAIAVIDEAGAVAIETLPGEVPAAFALHANYPNPFNPQMTIRFNVAEPAHVRLAVYDVLLVDRGPGTRHARGRLRGEHPAFRHVLLPHRDGPLHAGTYPAAAPLIPPPAP